MFEGEKTFRELGGVAAKMTEYDSFLGQPKNWKHFGGRISRGSGYQRKE